MIKIKKVANTTSSNPAFRGVSGRIISNKTLSVNSLASLCSQNNTVTRPDAIAVLDALFTEAERALKMGYSVDFGDLGTLRLTLSGEMSETLEDWNVNNNISRVNVRYTPSIALNEALNLAAENVNIQVI